MKRLIFTTFFTFLLLSSVVNNLATEERVFNESVYGTEEDGPVNRLYKRGGRLSSLFLIFSEYTGSETGFGLYAPRVSSQAVIYFSIRDESGRVVKTLQPDYTSKEALLRFYTLYGDALNKLKAADDPEASKGKLFDVVLKSLAFKILTENPGHKSIDADVYIYDLPTMADYPHNPEVPYTHLLHYEYSLP